MLTTISYFGLLVAALISTIIVYFGLRTIKLI
uniref:Cytochrome b6-f complex subunit 6 n=1 Tax=Picocystis salinarum TaxID=88271 RepID=A0A088CK13_9CHLO|nr:subunit VI of cytochrome b6/f complex [Picocystis salinarum]AID67607.1 subunit VI of cytochrome b6/f complex [Picocystis salinarum]